MTQQETFDFVVKHLYAQGKQALDSQGRCSYRTGDGLKCAAGCLIPDEEYNHFMEGLGIRTLVEDRNVKLSGHDINLVRSLQIVHDSYVPANTTLTWAQHLDQGLSNVAGYFKLVFTKPQRS